MFHPFHVRDNSSPSTTPTLRDNAKLVTDLTLVRSTRVVTSLKSRQHQPKGSSSVSNATNYSTVTSTDVDSCVSETDSLALSSTSVSSTSSNLTSSTSSINCSSTSSMAPNVNTIDCEALTWSNVWSRVIRLEVKSPNSRINKNNSNPVNKRSRLYKHDSSKNNSHNSTNSTTDKSTAPVNCSVDIEAMISNTPGPQNNSSGSSTSSSVSSASSSPISSPMISSRGSFADRILTKVDKLYDKADTEESAKETPLIGVLLSVWDYVFGPRAEHFWEGYCSPIEEEQQAELTAIAKRTLFGIDPSGISDSKLVPESRFLVLSHLGIIVSTMIFTAPHNGLTTTFALSFILKSDCMKTFLFMQKTIEDQLFRLVCKYRILAAATALNDTICNFTAELHKASKTVEEVLSTSKALIDPSTTFLSAEKINSKHFDLLIAALTSSLKNAASIVVTGNDPVLINMMVDGLSLFLSPKEREYCKHLCEDSTFVPGVPVQGLLNSKLDDEAMIQSLAPVMVVDIDSGIVYESLPYQIYKLIRRDYLIKDIELVVSPKGPSNLWTIRKEMLFEANAKASFLVDMASRIEELPSELRPGFIFYFMKLLKSKAAALAVCLETKMQTTRLSKRRTLKAKMQKLARDLSMKDEEDVAVILGLAERFSPGILTRVVGEEVIQEQLIELLGVVFFE